MNKLSEKNSADSIIKERDTSHYGICQLKAGNKRFVENVSKNRDLKKEVRKTSDGQSPFAALLSCIDSRVSGEIIFDQGIGDLFNVRIAGNFVNNDILGSLELAYQTGVKTILVLGHSQCGAIRGAIQHVGEDKEECSCDHVIPMVKNLFPAVKNTQKDVGESEEEYQERVTVTNVILNILKIREQSTCLRIAEETGAIQIIGGLYNVSTGIVSLFQYIDEKKIPL